MGSFLDLALPAFCLSCDLRLSGRRQVAFCESCWGRISLIEEPLCRRCGAPLEGEAFPQGGAASCRACEEMEDDGADRSLSAGLYEGVLKDAIHAYKLSGLESLAGPLAALAVAAAKDSSLPLRAQAVVPIPASPHRLRERGFDPTLLLARSVGEGLDLPVLERILQRPRGSVPQSRLKREARLRNPRGRFRVFDGEILNGLNLLLVDDILTTGATLAEGARALKQAGASRVEGLTIARGLPKR